MKQFEFSKYVPPSPVEEPKTEIEKEQTQEEFEAEILAEAEKLNTNVQKLKTEIDQYGGVEKFKEYFERKTGYTSGSVEQNVAGVTLRDLSSKADQEKHDSKIYLMVGGLLTALSVAIEYAYIAQNDINISDQLEGLKEAFTKGDTGSIVAAILGVLFIGGTAAGGLAGFITAIKDRIKARKINKEKNKKELEFKMTGVEAKQ